MSTSAEASGDRSIAAGQSILQALSGDGSVAYNVQKALTLPPEALALPDEVPSLTNLPHRAGLFVGRQRELALLDQAFTRASGVVVHAVHGLGGIGKSTLAARWARGQADAYNPLWWISAETPVDLDVGLADLAIALQPALRDVLSREALRERAVQWLAAHEGWLLILDNVSSPNDIEPLLARAPGGRFLITTRRATGWQGIAESLSLDVLAIDEAVRLFTRISDRDEEPDTVALCQELGCLPLAVEQAAAYCAEASVTPRAYRDLLSAHPGPVLASAAEDGDRERVVARIWQVTLDRLADTPLAACILRIVAWWAPESIPRSWLAKLGSALEVTEALRRLAAHSMITLHEDATLSVHRLVQAVARLDDPEQGTAVSARTRAITLLMDPDAMLDTGWITHAETLAARPAPEDEQGQAALLYLAISNWHRAHMVKLRDEPLAWAERAVSLAESAWGAEHEITLIAQQFLAEILASTGEQTRALSLLRQRVRAAERLYGPRDQLAFVARSGLLRLMIEQGDAAALTEARSNAARAAQVLGPSHHATLRAVGVMAGAWEQAVRKDPARHGRQAVAEIERFLEAASSACDKGDDGQVASLTRRLAFIHSALGDVDRALVLLEASLERIVQREGAHSILAFAGRAALVRVLLDAGRLDRVREQVLTLLVDGEEILGDVPFMRELRVICGPFLDPARGM